VRHINKYKHPLSWQLHPKESKCGNQFNVFSALVLITLAGRWVWMDARVNVQALSVCPVNVPAVVKQDIGGGGGYYKIHYDNDNHHSSGHLDVLPRHQTHKRLIKQTALLDQ
jgi:hypothetical protein